MFLILKTKLSKPDIRGNPFRYTERSRSVEKIAALAGLSVNSSTYPVFQKKWLNLLIFSAQRITN